MEWAMSYYLALWVAIAVAVIFAFIGKEAAPRRCALVLLTSEAALAVLLIAGISTGSGYWEFIVYVIACVGAFWPPAGRLQITVSALYLVICAIRFALICTVIFNPIAAAYAYEQVWTIELVALFVISALIIIQGSGLYALFSGTFERHIAGAFNRLVDNKTKGDEK